MICITSTPQAQSVPYWHEHFLAMLPTITRHARFAFRGEAPLQRAELVQETIANALNAYVRLVELGKAELAYPTVLARYAVAQIRCGRRVGNPLNTRDVLSHQAQAKGEFRVHSLSQPREQAEPWREAIADDLRTPVADQAAFRIDFPAWLKRHPVRQRKIALALVAGERPTDVARRFRLTNGRISQLRRAFYKSWQRYHGESV